MKNETKTPSRNTEMVTISRAEYEDFLALKKHNDELTQQVGWFMEQLRLMKKKVYGSSSEQTKEELVGQLSLLFDEAEAYLPAPEKKETTTVAAHTRQKRSSRLEEILPEDVPVEVVEHRMSAEELECPVCGDEMVEIGKEVRRSLVMIPAQVKIREDWYYTYACRTCKEEGTETPVVKTEMAAPVISGSYASAEAIAHITLQRGFSCRLRGNSPSDAEIRHGFSAVPAGAGVEPAGGEALPADKVNCPKGTREEPLGADVQLDPARGGGLAKAGVRGTAQTAGAA